MKAQCPECDADIELKPGVELGDPVSCTECGAQLEVISLKPAELDYALDLEEEEEGDEFDEDEEEFDEDWEEDEDEDLWEDEEEDDDEDDDF